MSLVLYMCLYHSFFYLAAIQAVSDEVKASPSHNADPPSETSGPVWTAYTDNYFDRDFAAPFSDLDEEEGEGEGEGETTSSGSSEGASQEDDPPTCGDVDGTRTEAGNKLASQLEGFTQTTVDSESPLSISSGDSHDQSSSSRNERLLTELCTSSNCYMCIV